MVKLYYLTHFMQPASGFPMFSVGIEIDKWHEIGLSTVLDSILSLHYDNQLEMEIVSHCLLKMKLTY